MPYYDPNREWNAKLFELILLVASSFGFGMLVATCTYFYLCPFSSVLIGSTIPPTTNILLIPLRLFMIYVFPHYLTFSYSAFASILLVAVTLYGVVTFPFLVRELNLGRKCYKTERLLRQPLEIIHVYRSAQILQLNANNVVQYLIIPSQTLVLYLTLFACVMIIKFGNVMSPSSKGMLSSWAFVACTAWTMVLMVGGYMHWYGKKVLESWKYYKWPRNGDKRVMSRFRKSCKPFMINFGKYYVIRRLSVLKFLRGISRGIFRSLLTLR